MVSVINWPKANQSIKKSIEKIGPFFISEKVVY